MPHGATGFVSNRLEPSQIKVGVCVLVQNLVDAMEIGAAADSAGVDVIGVADSPARFAGTYALTTLLLGKTTRAQVGPMVTNPVTCHPAVHGANLAVLEGSYPGRVMVALGTGDSGTAALGLPAARASALTAAVRAVASRTGHRVPVWVAASGPSAANAVPAEATSILLGGGLEPEWLKILATLAESAAGHRLERWAFLVGNLVGQPDQVRAARAATSAAILAVSRHSLQRDPGRAGVPAHLIADLAALYRCYNVRAHGEHAGSNADVLQGWPNAADYLYQRFGAIGMAESLGPRLSEVAAAANLKGFVFTTSAPGAPDHVRRVGRELRSLLRLSAS